MRSADYTRLADQLPPVYRDDEFSFAQVDAFLGLVDDVLQSFAANAEDVAFTLGPDALLRWPDDVPLHAGPDALVDRYVEVLDEMASWWAYRFPSTWGTDTAGLDKRRQFLLKAARLWRRRGTPRGFLDWFCLYFDLDVEDERPYLLEHFKAPGGPFTAEPYTATLFVPNTLPFHDYARRREAADFVTQYAPAHVFVRVCYVRSDFFDVFAPFADPAILRRNPAASDVTAYRLKLTAHISQLSTLLCSVVSDVDHVNGVHIYHCIDQGRTIDRLGVGRLPHLPDESGGSR